MNLCHEKISADVVVVDVYSIIEIKGYAMSRDTGWRLTINSYASNFTAFGRRCAVNINRCPKCGRKPKLFEWLLSGEYEVRCNRCELFGEVANTPKEAIEKWNEMTKVEK